MNLESNGTRMAKWALILVSGTVALVIIAGLMASLANAGQEGLAWDYPAGTNITGFKGYCGAAKGVYGATPVWTVPAANKTVTITLPGGRQYCVVRAYDAEGESGNSNELALLERPGNLRTTIVVVRWDEENRRVTMTWRSE
jgi:hypothetical protein